jgi:hypothetical protein
VEKQPTAEARDAHPAFPARLDSRQELAGLEDLEQFRGETVLRKSLAPAECGSNRIAGGQAAIMGTPGRRWRRRDEVIASRLEPGQQAHQGL